MTHMPAVVEMDVVGGPEAEGARRATGDSGPLTTSRATDPDPEVPAKATRRRFSAEYRLRILKRADACKKPGDVGALLRREGLYSSPSDPLAPAARARSARRHACPEARAESAATRSTRETTRGGKPSAPAETPAGGDDQSAGHNGLRGCLRNDDRRAGRPAAWGDPQTTARLGRSTDRARQQRGVDSVNAESGCLTIIDAARSSLRSPSKLSRRLFHALHLMPPVDLSHLHLPAAEQAEEQ